MSKGNRSSAAVEAVENLDIGSKHIGQRIILKEGILLTPCTVLHLLVEKRRQCISTIRSKGFFEIKQHDNSCIETMRKTWETDCKEVCGWGQRPEFHSNAWAYSGWHRDRFFLRVFAMLHEKTVPMDLGYYCDVFDSEHDAMRKNTSELLANQTIYRTQPNSCIVLTGGLNEINEQIRHKRVADVAEEQFMHPSFMIELLEDEKWSKPPEECEYCDQ